MMEQSVVVCRDMGNNVTRSESISTRTRRRFLAAAASAGTVAAAGCLSSAGGDNGTNASQANESAESSNAITHGAVQGGTTGALVKVISEREFDVENGAPINPKYFTSPPKVQKQIVYNDAIPTGFMGAMVATRLHGGDDGANPELVGPYQLYHMHVMARSDSDIDGPSDLAGKKVSYASKSADAWLKFVTVLNADHNVKPDELEFVQTAPPASIALLAKGELDAILQYEPLVTKALVQKDFEVVYSPRKAWKELTGLPLTTVDLAWSNTWYENNSDVAARFADTFKQGQQYLNENLESVIEKRSDMFGLETDEQISLAKKRLTNIYPTSWSGDLFDSEYRIVKRAHKLGQIDTAPTRKIFREDI